MTFISYAQNFEDVMLHRALRHVEHGAYIDVGAAHPDDMSVTKAFYERGWVGINVEPDPDFAAELRQSRPRDITLEVALGSVAGEVPFHRIGGTGLSTLDAGIADLHVRAGFSSEMRRVRVMTLADVCREHLRSEVHFLKIDVEGSELEVLRGADFNACRPWIVLVEATEPMTTTENHMPWEPILLRAGYSFVWFDGLNRFYVADEHRAELGPVFRTPVNVFDDFVRSSEVLAARMAAATEARAGAAMEEVGRQIAAATERVAEADRLRVAAEEETRRQIAVAAERVAEADRLRVAAEEETRRQIAVAAERVAEADRLRVAAEEETRRQLAVAAERVAEADRLRDAAQRFRDAAIMDAAALRASTSWRLTGPLRAVRQIARRHVGSALIEAGVSRPRVERLARVGGANGSALKRASRVTFYAATRVAARIPGAAWADRGLGLVAPRVRDWLRLRRDAYLASALGAANAPSPEPKAAPPQPPAIPISASAAKGSDGPRAFRVVHQFHSGSSPGDAITNSMLLIRRWLRDQGYESEIFVEHRHHALEAELLQLDDLPGHERYVLIVHHSMGYDSLDRVLALPASKVLMYHNITPSRLLQDVPAFAQYADIGRHQLRLMQPHMTAALADSVYNAQELRAAGYESPLACPFLFDVNALLADAAEGRSSECEAFTVLFVGRVVASKGQADLVSAFAVFRSAWNRPCRLILVGRTDGDDAPYPNEIRRRIAAQGLEEVVTLTGPVTDNELHSWYRAADLYVSLSEHEGFGVPLVEAMAHGVPVLAWPAGAVPYTLGGAGELLEDRTPETVARAMLALAQDPVRRVSMARRGREVVDGFRLERYSPRLLQALRSAGAAPPDDDDRAALSTNFRVAVRGHVNGTYSLATVNRSMATALESRRPGTVRIIPWENGPVDRFDGVPFDERDAIATLARRPVPATGPEIVLCQHYPFHSPEDPRDGAVAMVFWEESLLPAKFVDAINAGFRAVLAPSSFAAKALVDSGVGVPVPVSGYAPALEPFLRLGNERVGSPRAAGRPVTFLHVSSCFPRKGVDILLEAYAAAFRRDEPVRLVIKGFPNPHNEVAEQLATLRARDPEAPDIVFVNEDLGEQALLNLFAEADAVVLPTRGEGFNIPAAEAMAAGIPLIVTGYGGHLDFCTADEARFVDFRFAQSRSHLASGNSVWVEPDRAGLTRALRDVFEDQTGGGDRSAAMATRARDAVRRRLNAAHWADRAVDLMLDAAVMDSTARLRVAWVSTWNVHCGIAEYSRHLVEAVAAAGSGTELVILCESRTAFPPSGGLVPARMAWELGSADASASLARAIAVEDPEVVVIQHQPGLITWEHLVKLMRDRRVADRAVVVTLHAAPRLLDISAAERSATLAALREASRVLVHRVEDLNLLKDLGLIANVTFFPHGAPPRYGAPPARPLSPADAPIIGCFGFLLPGKGIDRLIEAAAALRPRWPRLRLRLINALHPYDPGDELVKCKGLAAERGLTDAIEWETAFLPMEECLRRLAGCDLIALPYDESKESSSAALRAALASGVPVAVTPVEIFAEAQDAVFRFAYTDASAVADGIDMLLREQHLRARCQEHAATWLADHAWSGLGHRLRGMLAGLQASRHWRRHDRRRSGL
jgi:FkbM family methyltransferase